MADHGDSRAQSLLGLIYSNGHGVQRNEAEAMKWYRRAADQGDADAQVKIGDMYFEGRAVAQDYSEAGRWYQFAADVAMLQLSTTSEFCTLRAKGFRWTMSSHICGSIWPRCISRRGCPVIVR